MIDVVYGDYILSEKSTLANYNLSNETRNVQIRTQGEKISLGQFTNQIIKGNVKVIKIDSENPQTTIPGVTFGLLQNGEIKYQATSKNNGEVLFEDVVYGGYILKELSGPKNYTINQEQVGVVVVENGVTVDLGTYKNKKIYGSAKLLKLDAQTKQPLAGVEFTLEKADGSKVVAVSDSEGIVTFSNLAYGGYVVTETKPLAGYVSSERQYGIVVAEDGQVFDIGTVENKRIVGNVFLRKFDATTNTPLSGVEFTLYNQNADEVAKAISDEEGNVNFLNVEYGFYTIKETNAVTGYKLSDEAFGVIIAEDGATIDLGVVYNQKIRGSVVLRKIDFTSKQPLAGVQFTITNDAGITIDATSDNEGIVRFDGLEYGTYRITESKPLSGYVATTEEFKVTIQEDGEVVVLGYITNKKIVKPVVNTNDSTFSFVTWMLLSLFGLYYLKKHTK